jgi:hypothetical protein
MELAGEEKQIRALFSELRFADEQAMPSFISTWHRAQSHSFRPQRAFNLSFVAAAALLVCALAGLAWWSRHWSQSTQPKVAIFSPPPVPSTTTTPTVPKSPEPKINADIHPRTKPHSVKSAARRESEQLALARADLRDAAAMSSWQSPTDSLMRSPGEQVLTTLPQLNDAATQLKSFLPDRDK